VSSSRDRDDLLNELLSLPPTERENFLRGQCGSNEELEAELRSLLRVHDTHADRLQLDASDAIPGSIGRYPVLQVLGRGGMGTIYLAIDPELDRKIAIKVVSREYTSHLSAERLRQEARLLASVSHPNLATVYSLETAGDRTFLTLELVNGPTLGDSFRSGPIPVREALIVFRQIAGAMAAIHRRRIVHRDLSPGNICITDGGLVKVLDFGLSTLVFESGERVQNRPTTLPNQLMGTPGYMSPELIRGEKADYRTDLWSFGCLLFQALAGSAPFPGNDIGDALIRTLKEEPDYTRLPPDLPDPVRDLLQNCLRKDMHLRDASMDSAIAILEKPLAPRTSRHPGRIVERRTSTNLPRPLSSFVGRTHELAQIRDAILRGGLITLKGMGGAGKTRLAIESATGMAGEFSDGVWFAAVAPLTSASQLVSELAKLFGVAERPRQELRETIIAQLKPMQALLVLDNAEHLLRDVASLAFDILSAAPSIVILATSRQSLGLPGERIVPVPPFPVDAPGVESPAVELFIQRSSEVRPDLPLTAASRAAIADICRHLDGLPLAIELAAVRTRSLPLSEIASRLRDRFSLLAQRNPTSTPHHQTLGLSMDHSYELLSDRERSLFRRLAVFPESWSLSASETICADETLPSWDVVDLLDALMDHSLVEADTDADSGQHRYRMLETVREYAARQLADSGEAETLRRRHRDFYLQLVEEAVFISSRMAQDWTVLDWETRNTDLALVTCAQDPDPVPGLRLASALSRYWELRPNWRSGLRTLREFIDRAHGIPAARPLLPRALLAAGRLASNIDDHELARSWFEEALEIAQTLGDAAPKGLIASCHTHLGVQAGRLGDPVRAISYLERAIELHRRNKDMIGEARALTNLISQLAENGDLGGAMQRSADVIPIVRRLGDAVGLAVAIHNLGQYARLLGKPTESRTFLNEALEIRRRIRDPHACAVTLVAIADVDLDEGNLTSASSRIREAVGLAGEDIHFRFLGELIRVFARAMLAANQPAVAIELISCGHRLAEENRAARFRADCFEPLSQARAAISRSEADIAWELGESLNDPIARIRSVLDQIAS
jgi:predicted ATPase